MKRGTKFFGANKGYEKRLMGAKISVENLSGMKNYHHFPKNTPTGYPDLKKTGPLIDFIWDQKYGIPDEVNTNPTFFS